MADAAYYIKQSNPSYDAQRASIQNRIDEIGDEKSGGALTKALDSLQDQYNQQLSDLDRIKSDYDYDAQSNAAKRGLGWSNIAQNYSANYAKNSYTPAVTNLQNNLKSSQASTIDSYNSRKYSLEDALNSLNREQAQWAMSQEQADRDREAQLQAQREAAEIQARAAKEAAEIQAASYYKATPTYGRGADMGYADDPSGFYFHDANGNLITAQEYSNQSGTGLNTILRQMASGGDANAIRALAGLNNANNQLTDEEVAAFNTLGISTDGYGRRA